MKLSLLSNRLEYIKKARAEIETQIARLKSEHLAEYVVINVKHNSLLMQAEEAAVSELICAIQIGTVL